MTMTVNTAAKTFTVSSAVEVVTPKTLKLFYSNIKLFSAIMKIAGTQRLAAIKLRIFAFALSVSNGGNGKIRNLKLSRSWFDKLTTNGLI
ncbi:MAG: hypothetical protein K9K84_00060 [Methylovulum sp.]|jgi:hypothetical protein|nr:hypothetical protein [Methylovulum sp.]